MQRGAQVFADGAADAAVAHLDDLLLAFSHEDVAVDVFLTEFVFDDGDFLAVGFLQDALEQRGFAGAEEAGDDGGGNEAHGYTRYMDKRGKERGKTGTRKVVEFIGQHKALTNMPSIQAFITTSPFKYSPSGKLIVIGWSGAPPIRSLM